MLTGNGEMAAAVHESGHAAVAHHLGCHVRGVEVHFDAALQRWCGSHDNRLTRDDLDQFQLLFRMSELSAVGCKVAVAGALAQAKHLRTRQAGQEVTFDCQADLADLVTFFRDNKRTEKQPGKLVVPLLVVGTGARVQFECAGTAFSSVDSKHFNYYLASVQGHSAEGMVRDTMKMLDEASLWEKVMRLAAALIAVPAQGEDKRMALDEPGILRIIEQE